MLLTNFVLLGTDSSPTVSGRCRRGGSYLRASKAGGGVRLAKKNQGAEKQNRDILFFLEGRKRLGKVCWDSKFGDNGSQQTVMQLFGGFKFHLLFTFHSILGMSDSLDQLFFLKGSQTNKQRNQHSFFLAWNQTYVSLIIHSSRVDWPSSEPRRNQRTLIRIRHSIRSDTAGFSRFWETFFES